MIATACSGTAERVGGLHVLAIQDTTSLRDDGNRQSIQAHPTIGVDAESGAVLGLVHADILLRKSDGTKPSRKRPFEEKDSRRWLNGAEAAAGLMDAGALCVTVLADREGDLYEALAQMPAGVDLVIRATHDRLLVGDGEDKAGVRLFAHLAAMPEAGRFEVDIAAAPGRRARKATMAVRFCSVSIKRPKNCSGRSCALPASVPVNLVEVREIDPPEGVTPAHWRLLTTHRVDSFATARWVARLYCQRWLIEELFRTLKTRGFDIERVGIAEGPFEKLAVAALIAAVSVLQLVRERDGVAKRPLTDVLDKQEQTALEAVSAQLEGKTEKQKNPHPKGSLAFAAWVCARLGGWTGYYGKPGPIVMLRGLHQFRAIQNGWSIAQNV